MIRFKKSWMIKFVQKVVLKLKRQNKLSLKLSFLNSLSQLALCTKSSIK